MSSSIFAVQARVRAERKAATNTHPIVRVSRRIRHITKAGIELAGGDSWFSKKLALIVVMAVLLPPVTLALSAVF